MSNLEDTETFYRPVLAWMREYLDSMARGVVFVFNLKHFNTASSKCFLDMLYLLEKYESNHPGHVDVRWHYNRLEPDMMDLGLDFQEETALKITLVPY
jgi:hypothetical protein